MAVLAGIPVDPWTTAPKALRMVPMSTIRVMIPIRV